VLMLSTCRATLSKVWILILPYSPELLQNGAGDESVLRLNGSIITASWTPPY